MRDQCIALIFVLLLTAAAKAATNMAPVPHLPQHQTKTVHSYNVLLPRRHQKVLGGGENSPLMLPSLRGQNSHQTWCFVVRTQHHQPTTLGTETIQTES